MSGSDTERENRGLVRPFEPNRLAGRGDGSQEKPTPLKPKKEVHTTASLFPVNPLTSLPVQDVADWVVHEESAKADNRVPNTVEAGR